MSEKHAEFDDLLREERTFAPPSAFRAQANVRDASIYAEAERDPEAFWARFAGELEWSRRLLQVMAGYDPADPCTVDTAIFMAPDGTRRRSSGKASRGIAGR